MGEKKLNVMGIEVPNVNVVAGPVQPTNDAPQVMMSDELRDQVPELQEDDLTLSAAENCVIAVTYVVHGDGDVRPFTGAVTSLGLLSDCIELEVNTQLDDAFTVLANSHHAGKDRKITVGMFELHRGETVVPFVGPYNIDSIAVSNVDYQNGMCLLIVKLVPIEAPTAKPSQ